MITEEMKRNAVVVKRDAGMKIAEVFTILKVDKSILQDVEETLHKSEYSLQTMVRPDNITAVPTLFRIAGLKPKSRQNRRSSQNDH